MRGTLKEVRTALVFLLGVAFLMAPFPFPNLPCALPHPRRAWRTDPVRAGRCAQASAPRHAAVSARPSSDLHLQLFCQGGRRGLGGQESRTLPRTFFTPLPSPPQSAPRADRAQPEEPSPVAATGGLWARPAPRPLNGRLCSSPGAAERARGRRHNGHGPHSCALSQSAAPRRPLPCAPAARSLARRAAADSIASFMSSSLSSRHSPPPPPSSLFSPFLA